MPPRKHDITLTFSDIVLLTMCWFLLVWLILGSSGITPPAARTVPQAPRDGSASGWQDASPTCKPQSPRLARRMPAAER